MAKEIRNMSMAFSKSKKVDKLEIEFGIDSKEMTIENEITPLPEYSKKIENENTEELRLNANRSINFDKKGRYNLTLDTSTISKLSLLEKSIKKNSPRTINKGLRSRLVDHIINNYFDELYEEINGKKVDK